MNFPSYRDHLPDWESLVTPYEATRSGFVALALEKNRKATPFVEEGDIIQNVFIKSKEDVDGYYRKWKELGE